MTFKFYTFKIVLLFVYSNIYKYIDSLHKTMKVEKIILFFIAVHGTLPQLF